MNKITNTGDPQFLSDFVAYQVIDAVLVMPRALRNAQSTKWHGYWDFRLLFIIPLRVRLRIGPPPSSTEIVRRRQTHAMFYQRSSEHLLGVF